MPVERKKDGSIAIKGNNGVTVIGRIMGVSNDKQKERFKQWVDECAKLVNQCAHTIKETEQFFLEQCDAIPLAQNDRRVRNFQYNVIINYCQDKLKYRPSEFSFDMTDEEMEKWQIEQDAIREEAMNSPAEYFGLKIHGYYLPHTERNEVFYKHAHLKMQNRMSTAELKQIKIQDICFFFEETTGHYQSSSSGDDLINKLVIFKGVSQDDIEKRSPQFLGYISAMRDMGNLPGIIE